MMKYAAILVIAACATTPSENDAVATVDGTTKAFSTATWDLRINDDTSEELSITMSNPTESLQLTVDTPIGGHVAQGTWDCSWAVYRSNGSEWGSDNGTHTCSVTLASSPKFPNALHVTFTASLPNTNGESVSIRDGVGDLASAPR